MFLSVNITLKGCGDLPGHHLYHWVYNTDTENRRAQACRLNRLAVARFLRLTEKHPPQRLGKSSGKPRRTPRSFVKCLPFIPKSIEAMNEKSSLSRHFNCSPPTQNIRTFGGIQFSPTWQRDPSGLRLLLPPTLNKGGDL